MNCFSPGDMIAIIVMNTQSLEIAGEIEPYGSSRTFKFIEKK
jgi:hypothetical protein